MQGGLQLPQVYGCPFSCSSQPLLYLHPSCWGRGLNTNSECKSMAEPHSKTSSCMRWAVVIFPLNKQTNKQNKNHTKKTPWSHSLISHWQVHKAWIYVVMMAWICFFLTFWGFCGFKECSCVLCHSLHVTMFVTFVHSAFLCELQLSFMGLT